MARWCYALKGAPPATSRASSDPKAAAIRAAKLRIYAHLLPDIAPSSVPLPADACRDYRGPPFVLDRGGMTLQQLP